MLFGPQRGHIACIFDHFFKDFGLVLLAAVISLIQGDMDLLLENVGILAIVLLNPVLRVLGYLTTTYAVDEEKLIIKSGILTKNALEIPLSTITTVDLSQNIFHQIFGVYKLNIDNNSNISNAETKVHMTLKKDDADAVKGLLMQGRKGMDGSNFAGEQNLELQPTRDDGRRFEIKGGRLLLMGLMKSKALFLFELLGAAAVVANLIPMDLEEETLIDGFFDVVNHIGATPSILIGLALLFVIGAIGGMIVSFIQYYGFKVLDNGEALKIEYGLLNHKSYTIAKKKISGFYYEQSVLMRLAKVGTLNLMAVGYGAGMDEDSSEEAILLPMIQESRVREIIGEILPEMRETMVYQKPEKKALRYFFVRFSVFFALGCLAGCFFLPRVDAFFDDVWILGVLYLVSRLLGAVLDYKTTGICGNEEHFVLCYGGYKKMTVYVKTSMIESIESRGSLWKRKRGIGSIEIGCLAPLGLSSQSVDNLPLGTFEALRTYLIY